jgi:hypothetical protein
MTGDRNDPRARKPSAARGDRGAAIVSDDHLDTAIQLSATGVSIVRDGEFLTVALGTDSRRSNSAAYQRGSHRIRTPL